MRDGVFSFVTMKQLNGITLNQNGDSEVAKNGKSNLIRCNFLIGKILNVMDEKRKKYMQSDVVSSVIFEQWINLIL